MNHLWLCDLQVLRFLCIEFETDPSKSSLKPLPCRILWIFCEFRLRWRPDGFVCWQLFVKVDSTLMLSSVSWEDGVIARIWRTPGSFADKPSHSGTLPVAFHCTPMSWQCVQTMAFSFRKPQWIIYSLPLWRAQLVVFWQIRVSPHISFEKVVCCENTKYVFDYFFSCLLPLPLPPAPHPCDGHSEDLHCLTWASEILALIQCCFLL